MVASGGRSRMISVRGSSGGAGGGATAGGGSAFTPPVAKRVPASVSFGAVAGEDRGPDAMEPPIVVDDDLFWLRDDERKDAVVLDYLKAENAHTAAAVAHLEHARKVLFAELKGHLKETDREASHPHGPYDYFTRTEEGKSYVIHCRRPKGAAAEAEAVVLDENAVAEGHKFCSTGEVKPSPSHRYLCYSVDTAGYETFELRFVDLETGQPLDDVIPDADAAVSWGADDGSVYYCKMDAAHRPHELWRHVLGTPPNADTLLLTERDEKFWLGFAKSASGKYLFAASESKETAEVHAVRLDAARPKAICVAPRRPGVLYEVDHRGSQLLILSNDRGAKNFGLFTAPEGSTSASDWAPMEGFAYDPSRTLESVVPFKDYTAVFGREGGLTAVWLLHMAAEAPTPSAVSKLPMPEAAYHVGEARNEEYESAELRLAYSSMVTPPSVFAVDMSTGARTVVKEREVPDYDRALYTTERTVATARDGTEIPVSIVFRTDAQPAGGTAGPMLLYGYGSYGMSMEPSFSMTRLALLDRGVRYAIAHVRGGGEMGRGWYEEQGKYLTKMNTFTDFIDVARSLQARGLTSPSQLAIEGRSAGGLLMGAVMNLAPETFKCVVAGVPFVDVMVSMCDPSIPLTVGEWEEWGNPNAAQFYEYMRSYSPMENVGARDYPATLVTAGLFDPRVAYWEPSKWVARLRAAKTNDAPLLLKMDLDSGHFSASDRYKYLEQIAFESAFVLDQLGLLGELRDADGEAGGAKMS